MSPVTSGNQPAAHGEGATGAGKIGAATASVDSLFTGNQNNRRRVYWQYYRFSDHHRRKLLRNEERLMQRTDRGAATVRVEAPSFARM